MHLFSIFSIITCNKDLRRLMMAVITNEVKRSLEPARLPQSLRLPRNDGIHTGF